MAQLLEKALACQDCGTRLGEWDPKQGGHRQAYAATTWVCPGCMQAEAVWGDIHKSGDKGKKVRLEPTRYNPQYRPKVG